MQLSSWNNCLAELETALKIGGPSSASPTADIVTGMNNYVGIVGRRECVKSLGLICARNSLLFNYGTVYVMEGNSSKVQTSYT